MRFTLHTSGGFAGLLLKPQILDSTQLSPALRDQLHNMVKDSNLLDGQPSTATPADHSDRLQFELTIDANGRSHTVSLSEAGIPTGVRKVIEFIRNHATQ